MTVSKGNHTKRLPYVLASVAIAGGTLAAGISAVPAAASPRASASAVAPVMAGAPAQALQPWPVLREGLNGTWPPVTVRSLQYLLKAHGAQVAADGSFGPKTKAAVVAFQRARKLPSTGVVRAATWKALLVSVRRGSTGPAVRAVQDQINFRNGKNGHTLRVDGAFGPRTEKAVRAFQRAMAAEIPGFPVDGIVGPMTWQALVTEALSG
jgi:peptidoglycan hydrolase-like protein with peptidoglycan-binding domain